MRQGNNAFWKHKSEFFEGTPIHDASQQGMSVQGDTRVKTREEKNKWDFNSSTVSRRNTALGTGKESYCRIFFPAVKLKIVETIGSSIE